MLKYERKRERSKNKFLSSKIVKSLYDYSFWKVNSRAKSLELFRVNTILYRAAERHVKPLIKYRFNSSLCSLRDEEKKEARKRLLKNRGNWNVIFLRNLSRVTYIYGSLSLSLSGSSVYSSSKIRRILNVRSRIH